MPKAAFLTLGCKVNQFETETMEGLFLQKGYEIIPFTETADVYVINTCSVTSLSDRKSRQMIRRALRQNPNAVIAAVGCYAQASPDEVSALDGIRVVLGTRDRGKIVDLVEQAMKEDGIINNVTDIMKADEFENIPLFGIPARTRAFLKIEEGCENFCSYCIIPYTRGPVRSRSIESVHHEAQKLIEKGFLEIVLTGIHLGAYGRDFTKKGNDINLSDAVKEVLSIPELKRLRLGSLESIELSEELFELMRNDKRFCRHLHLPLQSGSDEILKAMNRHYDTAEFSSLLNRVEKAVPGIAISTDIIVGFPGETEALFQESLDFAEKMGFSRMHVFPYSPRSGTVAARREDQIPEHVKKERVHRMQELAEKKAQDFHKSFLGKSVKVLFETNTDGIADGLTDNYIRIYTDNPVITGEIYEVELIRLYRDGIWGTLKNS